MEPVAAVDTAPATVPITSLELSFADQRKANAAGKDAIAVPAVAKPEATPEAEADSAKPDAALSEAARVLRKNRADERKAKIQREIDDGVREREHTRAEVARERAELDRLKQERASLTRGEPARPAAAPATGADSEPTLESFIAENPQHPDPYVGWQRDLAKWDRRQEDRARFAQSQSHANERRQADVLAKFHAATDAVRAEHSDYDVAWQTLTEAVQAHPSRDFERDLTIALAESPLGARVGYYLAKHPQDRSALLTAPTRDALLKLLGRIEHGLTAPAYAAPSPSSAPAPHTPVGGGSTVTESDENAMTFGQLHKKRQAQRAASR